MYDYLIDGEIVMKKVFHLFLVCVLVLFLQPFDYVSANKSSQPLSPGVTLNKYTYPANQVNHISINLSNSFAKLDVGLPSSYGALARTTEIANSHSYEGHRVVGAINAAFYDMSSGHPLYLIAKNNEIYNGGIIASSSSHYVSHPIAFGVTADGLAEIDGFDMDIWMQHNGQNYEIQGLNRERQTNEAILYTPQHYSQTTNSNQYGVEYVVETPNMIDSTYFGQTLVGNVVKIRSYGSTEKTEIPRNGFVISANGDHMKKFENIKVGDEIKVSISINQTWRDAQFILASGPMLVRDGKRYITMDTSSSRAKEVAPRSAIGISKDKKTVHFITVDGRQSNSKGMNLVQFADYLASLGVDRAINLDGGGSTTMAFRNYGSNQVVLANRPSNSGGAERRVSAILEAISTAPTSEASQLKYTRTNVGTLLAGTGSRITVEYVLDEYYNPLPVDPSRIALVSENQTLSIDGLTFISTKAANDRIFITYDGKTLDSFPVKVVDSPTTLAIKGNKEIVNGTSVQFTVEAKDDAGNPIIFDANRVTWKVDEALGYFVDNRFTAVNAGKGTVTATLGDKEATFEIEVVEKVQFKDVPKTHPYFKEISYFSSKKYINGYEDGTFKPDKTLTRAHAAVILSKILELDTSNVENPNFKDVPTSHVYYKEIAAVANNHLFSGKGDGTFDPNGELTRGQMAKIISLAFELKASEGGSAIQFKDVSNKHWAYSYVQALAQNNVTTGFQDGTFKPEQNISRAHFVVFVYRAIHQ